MVERNIPVVNLDQFTQGSQQEKESFVNDLGNAFHKIGFVTVANHGIPTSLIEHFYKNCKVFFSLPESVKEQYRHPAERSQLGYTAFGVEHARQSEIADLKEFFQIGQEVPKELNAHFDYDKNVAVADVPDLLPVAMKLFRAFEATGKSLLQAIALYLKLEEYYFDAKINSGNSILRAIHYPPITREPASAIRAEQHEDINLITLLVGASAGGLQVLDKTGRWLDISPGNDEIVINVGDMLQRLTNNYLKSTTHRVVNPPKAEWHQARLSMPFFLHPVKEMDLTCLSSCVTEEQPLAYKPITAIEYLEERLMEIGLKKVR